MFDTPNYPQVVVKRNFLVYELILFELPLKIQVPFEDSTAIVSVIHTKAYTKPLKTQKKTATIADGHTYSLLRGDIVSLNIFPCLNYATQFMTFS